MEVGMPIIKPYYLNADRFKLLVYLRSIYLWFTLRQSGPPEYGTRSINLRFQSESYLKCLAESEVYKTAEHFVLTCSILRNPKWLSRWPSHLKLISYTCCNEHFKNKNSSKDKKHNRYQYTFKKIIDTFLTQRNVNIEL